MTRRPVFLLTVGLVVVCLAPEVLGEGGVHPHSPEAKGNGLQEELNHILLATAGILLLAKLGAHFCATRRLPAVLGELGAGIVVGNLPLVGVEVFEFLRHEHVVELLGELGLLLLMFQVGLESDLRKIVSVGPSALLVAFVGVVAPFGLGAAVSWVMLPQSHFLVHVFVGATLSATSVGITTRLLADMGVQDTPESRIILGAAVLDDVLGLVVLGLVGGAIAASNGAGSFGGWEAAAVVLKAAGFFAGSIAFGVLGSRHLFVAASKLRGKGLLLATALVLCFGFSYLGSVAGLAPLVGAFCAGLVLDEVRYRDLMPNEERTLPELVEPIGSFLVPLFFVVVGFKVDLSSVASMEVIALAGLLTLAAVLGKLACGVAVLEEGVRRPVVGLAMVPRGEVGLVFAGLGTSLLIGGEPVLAPHVYAALVGMVVVTTTLPPVFLAKYFQAPPELEAAQA